MTTLPITITVAAAATLLNLWLGLRVTRLRRLHHVSIGDGGNPQIAARMRSHANFVEYVPLFLILLGLVEAARGSSTWLWAAAILFILGRLAHPFGMDRPAPNWQRLVGMALTWLVLLGLALYALTIPYLDRPKAGPVTYAAQS